MPYVSHCFFGTMFGICVLHEVLTRHFQSSPHAPMGIPSGNQFSLGYKTNIFTSLGILYLGDKEAKLTGFGVKWKFDKASNFTKSFDIKALIAVCSSFSFSSASC